MRRAVQIVWDDEANTIAFEVPSPDGAGDVVLTLAVHENRVVAVESAVDQLILDALMGGL